MKAPAKKAQLSRTTSALIIVGLIGAVILGYSLTLSPTGNPTPTNIVDNPTEYLGKNVTVRGEVDDRLSSRAIVLDQEGTVKGDEVLVISRQPLEPVGGGADDVLFDEGKDVMVDGEVRSLNRGQLEQELGITLDTEIFSQWQGKAIIVADRIITPEE